MTRETKVGLVVACSFVCLVCVVVWQKLRNKQNEENPIALAPVVTPPENSPAKSDGKANPKTDVTQAGLQVPGQLPDLTKSAKNPDPLENLLPPETTKQDLAPVANLPDPKEVKLPDPNEFKLPDPKEFKLPDLTKPINDGKAKAVDFQNKIKEDLRKAMLPQGKTGTIESPPPVKPPDPIALPPLGTLAQNDGKDNKFPEAQATRKDGKELPPPPAPIEPPPVAIGKAPADPKPVADPIKPVQTKPESQPNPTPLPPPVVGKENPPIINTPPKIDVPPIGTTPVNNPNQPKIDVPPIATTNNPPPLGTTNNPPPLVKNPNAQTNVAQADTYFVQEGDTLPAISQKAYGTDRFAQAILAYNSKYNPDTVVRENLQGNNPRLFKGMALVLMPRDWLISRYGNLIQGIPTSNPPVSIKPPMPVTNIPPVAAKVNTPDPTKRYRVPAEGQHIFEIARQTLGNPNRWSEILRLNPSLRTEYPIPGGTELLLPGNATVP